MNEVKKTAYWSITDQPLQPWLNEANITLWWFFSFTTGSRCMTNIKIAYTLKLKMRGRPFDIFGVEGRFFLLENFLDGSFIFICCYKCVFSFCGLAARTFYVANYSIVLCKVIYFHFRFTHCSVIEFFIPKFSLQFIAKKGKIVRDLY